MKHASPDEYFALLVATLVLIVVLISSFMCIQLYHLRKPGPPPCSPPADSGGGNGSKEGFLGELYYSPSCGSEWLGRRRSDCRGITTGVMPSIETTSKFGNGLCSGRLGVPP
jgi:hypothetical protein